MSLNKKILSDGMRKFQLNPPKNVEFAAKLWAELIFDYSKAAFAANVSVRFVQKSRELEKNILKSMKNQVFLNDLGKNLQIFWQSAVWANPTFTGVTSYADKESFRAAIVAAQATIMAGANGPDKISTAIDTWTRSVLVVLTNVSSGATSTAPLT